MDRREEVDPGRSRSRLRHGLAGLAMAASIAAAIAIFAQLLPDRDDAGRPAPPATSAP